MQKKLQTFPKPIYNNTKTNKTHKTKTPNNSDRTYVRVNVAMERQNDRKKSVAFPNEESSKEKWVEPSVREEEWCRSERKRLVLGLLIVILRLRIATEAIDRDRQDVEVCLYFVVCWRDECRFKV